MMFAQQLDTLPAGYWKNYCIAGLVGFGVVATLLFLYFAGRKPGPPARSVDDPPLKREVVSKRYNHDAIEQRFGTIETTLQGHEAELDFNAKEIQRMRDESAKMNLTISVSLARLETHFGLKEKREP